MGVATSVVSWGGLGICLGIGGLGLMMVTFTCTSTAICTPPHAHPACHAHPISTGICKTPHAGGWGRVHAYFQRYLHHLHAHRTDARLWRDYDETGATTRVWQEGARPRRDLGETLATSQPHPTIPGHIRSYFAGHIR